MERIVALLTQVKTLSSESSEGSGKIKAIFPPGPFKPSGLSKALQVWNCHHIHSRSTITLSSMAVQLCPHRAEGL